jgi:hypothetical protein
MDGPIRTSLAPCHQYAKMGRLIRFLHATTMPPIRQNERTKQNIDTSMQPIRQNGRTNDDIDASIQHIRQNGRSNQNNSISMPPHTPKWKDLYQSCMTPPCHPYAKMVGPIRTSQPPCHPYAKTDGLAPFLHVTAMPHIRKIG